MSHGNAANFFSTYGGWSALEAWCAENCWTPELLAEFLAEAFFDCHLPPNRHELEAEHAVRRAAGTCGCGQDAANR
jgi:hypothetical protein